MDNNNHNLIIIIPNQNFRTNNQISSRRREFYKLLFSSIIYMFIIPFILFFLTNKHQNNLSYIIDNNNYVISNSKNNENINDKKRNLNGENIYVKVEPQLSNRNNLTAFEEEIKKYINSLLERFDKNLDLNNLFIDNSQKYSKEYFYTQQEKQLFITKLTSNEYKGTWEYYPYNPYKSKDENNFENYYSKNFSDINKFFYFNSSKNIFKIGNDQSGIAYINFKKAYQKNTIQEALAITMKILEGKYFDNWMQHLSFTRLSSIKKFVDEERKRFYFRGEFTTSLSYGKILNNQNTLKNRITCPTLIEAEFPLSKSTLYLIYGNKTEPPKTIYSLDNKNFTMILSSLCGFRIKINAQIYNQNEDKLTQQIKKELTNYFWMNIIISILNFFVTTLVTCNLKKHQDTVTTFSNLCLSENIAWHFYKSVSDINLGLHFPFFFGSFLLMALFSLINFIGFDLRLLVLYWRINKRVLSNRQFINLRLKFFFIFYFFMFCTFISSGTLFFDKKIITISAALLWTPQIIHNIFRYNKYSYPLIYILMVTLDRMINPFYFRGFENNLLNIKTDKNFLTYVAGFILVNIIILYLQVFLGPRFMLGKKYQRVEMNFYRNKAQLLREKPNAVDEECTICLCPLFNNEEINNKVNNSKNIINENIGENSNREVKLENDLGKQSNNNTTDLMNSNQINQKNNDILEIANKKKLKTAKKMNLYKNKVNPIIITGIHLNKKSKYRHKNKDTRSICTQIMFIIKSIFWNNLIFFYKYNPNLKNKKYMLIRCGHMFHTACLEKWFEMKKECPSCRASMEHYI